MKKLFLFLWLSSVALCSSFAQGIYKEVKKYDKFDDVESDRRVKTLITKTDSTIIIETKGQDPEVFYYADNLLMANYVGDRDNVKNLVNNVWGYEVQYKVIPESQKESYDKAMLEFYEKTKDMMDVEISPDDLNSPLLRKFFSTIENLPVLVFRTISDTRYTFTYDTELAWIRYPDGSRTIYSK